MSKVNKASICFYGYTDNMSGVEKVRTENALSTRKIGKVTYKLVNYNDVVYSYTEYIRQMLKDGLTLREDNSGKRTEYSLVYPNGFYIEITKTQYGFAKYLLENGFVDDEKAYMFQNEIVEKQKQAEEQAKSIQEETERKQQEWLERKESYDHKVGIYDTYTEKNFPHAVDIAHIIASKEGFSYNAHNLRVLTLLTHPELINDSGTRNFYEEELGELLNRHNHISRKLFTEYSGIAIGNVDDAVKTWMDNPVVMLPQKKASESAGRTVLQKAIDGIIADNGCDCRLPEGAFMRGDHFIIFNAYRAFHLNEKVDGIHMVDGTPFEKEKALFDRFSSTTDRKEVIIPHSYKEMSDWKKNNKGMLYGLVDAYPTGDNKTHGFINPKYLEEALRILGLDVIAYFCKNWSVYLSSPKGEGVILCVRSVDGVMR